MKFNKKLSFDATRELQSELNSVNTFESRKTSLTTSEKRRRSSGGQNSQQTLDSRLATDNEFSYSFVGLAGVFIPIKNDFSSNPSVVNGAANQQEDDEEHPNAKSTARYRDANHWTNQTRQKVKRVRFVVCILALFGLAFGIMSRLMLNVSIVEMVKRSDELEEQLDNELSHTDADLVFGDASTENFDSIIANDPIIFAATSDNSISDEKATTLSTVSTSTTISYSDDNSTLAQNLPNQTDQDNEDDGLRFDWSKQDVNLILGSFYMGYMPGILFSGDLAQRYGAKYPLLLCIFGTSLINALTPLIARYNLNLLIGSRILLGLIQGSLFPALYELFNRWLTPTESSVFAPMIKVSMPLGSLMGTLMPGLLAQYKLKWPVLFYIGSFLCAVWSIVWLFVATSKPQANRFVGQNELDRIMRKKSASFKMVEMSNGRQRQEPTTRRRSSGQDQASSQNTQIMNSQGQQHQQANKAVKKATPWFEIVTNPSVLALTLVKFTYNIGMDFIFLQLAVYLREAHDANIETISAIASCGYLMQMLLISFVGWLAKIAVLKRVFGLSVTKWRKIFQGGANLLMAAAYLVLAYLDPPIEIATGLLLAVCFFWMLGAGGESLVPYDLSSKYPASIVGFAHSVSIFSGIALTAICNSVLGENTTDSSKWSLLFYILASFLAIGGLVFISILKAKPFLPGEKRAKSEVIFEDKKDINMPISTQQVANLTIQPDHSRQHHNNGSLNSYK